MLKSLILTGGYMKTLKIAMLSGLAALTIGVVGVLATPVQASAYSGTTGRGCTAYQYRRGNSSTCVRYIQQMLNGTNAIYGFYYGGALLSVDGSFGPMTETQVKRFQGMMSLKVDGIVGPNTWNSLCYLAGQIAFRLYPSGSLMRTAWDAAYDAGCYVEAPTVVDPGYYTTTIFETY